MARPFSRYKTGIKLQRGQILKYIPGQGYTTQATPAVRQAAATAAAPFDYGNALQNEGIFAADSADLAASNDVAQARRDAAVKALQFQYNDPANPFSTVGEAERDRKSTVANMLANRAARGVTSSGGTTLAQMDIGHDFSKGLYGALNDVTGRIGGLDADLADTLRQNKSSLGNALTDAQGRLIDHGIGGSPGGSGIDTRYGAPAVPGQNGGTFDLAGAQRSFPNGINPGASFAKPFDYGSIQAGYHNPFTGKAILDPSITGASYNRQALGQSQAAQANPLARKKALSFAMRGF